MSGWQCLYHRESHSRAHLRFWFWFWFGFSMMLNLIWIESIGRLFVVFPWDKLSFIFLKAAILDISESEVPLFGSTHQQLIFPLLILQLIDQRASFNILFEWVDLRYLLWFNGPNAPPHYHSWIITDQIITERMTQFNNFMITVCRSVCMFD